MIDLPRIPLILGTRNRKKGLELAQLVAPPWEPNPRLARLDVKALDAYPDVPDVVEDADTFAGNARKKASEVARTLGLWVLADDSGLAVDALQGAPGVYSARYAGEPADDAANNRKLLEALEGVLDVARGAPSSAISPWPIPPAPSGSKPRGPVEGGSSASFEDRAGSATTPCSSSPNITRRSESSEPWPSISSATAPAPSPGSAPRSIG